MTYLKHHGHQITIVLLIALSIPATLAWLSGVPLYSVVGLLLAATLVYTYAESVDIHRRRTFNLIKQGEHYNQTVSTDKTVGTYQSPLSHYLLGDLHHILISIGVTLTVANLPVHWAIKSALWPITFLLYGVVTISPGDKIHNVHWQEVMRYDAWWNQQNRLLYENWQQLIAAEQEITDSLIKTIDLEEFSHLRAQLDQAHEVTMNAFNLYDMHLCRHP